VEGERKLVNEKKKKIINLLDRSVVDKINIKLMVAEMLHKNTSNQLKD